MLKITILFLLLLPFNLFASTLSPMYFVQSKNIKLQDIFPNAKYNITLDTIQNNRYSKKIKTKELKKELAKHGFENLESSSRYIKFIIKSPIDSSFIENKIAESYKKNYPKINIAAILVVPRAYIKSLPIKYTVKMPKKFYLSKSGTLSIKTLQNKKIFFDYFVDATLSVYRLNHTTKKGTRISALNTKKELIELDKFRDIPINIEHLNISQTRRSTKEKSILTMKDIQTLNLVVKGSHVIVNHDTNNINISFSAKALQSGKLHDIITVQKNNMKRLRVQIIGKNQVKIK